jgi:Tellurite resistance protein TehB.
MDKSYWEDFYARQNAELKPSLFARFVSSLLDQNQKSLIELGCGNGRDSLYFANLDHNVTAIDQCESEIKFLKSRYQKCENLIFRCADFSQLESTRKYDVIYSRFTLHSVDAQQEAKVCSWAFENLNHSGIFCVEVRGQKNEIFKFGDPVEGDPDAFIYNDHYRRFVNFDRFCSNLKQLGFHLPFAAEEKGFAPFMGKDETYIRVIAKR